ncbi:MAG: hypothetical protein RLZZ522_306 [Verrucomicrobiota bacterium]
MFKENLKIVRVTLQRFRRALGVLMKSEYGPEARKRLVGLVLCMVGVSVLNVLTSYVARDFMSAIEHQNLAAFWRNAAWYLVVFAASTVVAVFYRFSEERMGLVWREQLTRRFTGFYLSERTYYRLDSATGVANTDQRIADDVRAFTTTTLSFSLLFLNGLLAAVSFSGVLWSISPLLFGVAVGYALCGTALTIWLGKPLVRLNYQQLDAEAAFRAELIHVRENSESIALAHREGRIHNRAKQRINALTGNFRKIVGVNRRLGFFTTGYNYLIQLIPALIVAPLFITGEIQEFGVITQSAMAFSALLGALSLIVTQFQSISAFTAVTSRLNGLSEAMEKTHKTQPSAMTVVENPQQLAFSGVTLRSADGKRLLVDQLELALRLGEQWVVTCPEDEPKVALLRATAGIWEQASGRIVRPGLDQILFLPERPYLPPGVLWDILVRTDNDGQTDRADVLDALQRLDLADAVARIGGLEADQDWDDLLSIGEQHLLSVVRILLAQPTFVVLDRPGSSLAKEQIQLILTVLREHGMGVIVFAKNGESHLCFDGELKIGCDAQCTVIRH